MDDPSSDEAKEGLLALRETTNKLMGGNSTTPNERNKENNKKKKQNNGENISASANYVLADRLSVTSNQGSKHYNLYLRKQPPYCHAKMSYRGRKEKEREDKITRDPP